MIISLTLEQQTKLLNWSGKINEDHANADCLSPGYYLEIGICSIENTACAVCGSLRLELGDVEVNLSK